MRASIAHVLGTAALVALPALVSAQAPAAPAAQAPAAAPAPPPPVGQGRRSRPRTSISAWFAPVGDGKENPPKYEPKRIKLSDFKGKQNVVVAFFPAAFSPGCTNEMKQYQTSHGTFTAANTKVLGVSVDSTWSNRAFREQLGVEFPILSDWKRDAARRLRPARRATPASPAAPRSSSTRPASCARSTSAARRSIRPASSGCARRSKPSERGPAPTRNHPRHRRSRLLHRSRRTAARLAVGDQPADPPARRGAERGRLPARRPAHPHHAGGRSAAPAQSPRLPGSEGHGRADQRLAPGPARPGAAGRRDDGQPLRLPHPAPRVPTGPPAVGDQDLGGRDRPLSRRHPRRHRRLRPPHPAHRIARPRHRPGHGGRAPARHLADPPAGAQAAHRARRSARPALRPVRERLEHAPRPRRVLRPREPRRRTS